MYLDPDSYIKQKDEELNEEYICVICCGVVLQPVECKECFTLYCKTCLTSMQMPCPKRCGASEYGAVNRHVMNNLSKHEFKCIHQNCTDKV